jgi:arylsulfatase A-like enzyme
MTRPNIVVFIPDQLRADALGCFGNPAASTPAIDELAARGVRFENAFGQHPFCSPSRVSFLTGWYPHVGGHRTLTSLLKPWEPNALGLLKAAGYHVAHCGMRGDTFATGTTKEATSRFGWAVVPERVGHGIRYGPEHRYARAFYDGRRDGPALDFDEACVQTAEQWLGEGLPEPWLLYVPLVFPHPPFTAEEPWFSLHDRADMPAPITVDYADKPRYMRAIHDRYGLARMSPDDWAEVRATYYGMVSRVDDHLRRVLEAAHRAGDEERTAVLFFPDHGEYLGDYGLVEKWVSGLHPAIVRNPLIASIPGGAEGAVATTFAELVDVAPTLYELAEVDPGYHHFGHSLVPVLRDPSTPHRDAAFSEGGYLLSDLADAPDQPFPYDLKHGLEASDPVTAGRAAAVRTAEWTYVHRLYEDDELYDRRADPHETVNLAADPALAPVVTGLRDRLLRWYVETSDVIPTPPDPRFDADGARFPPRR